MWSIAQHQSWRRVTALGVLLFGGTFANAAAQSPPPVIRSLKFKGNQSIDAEILATWIQTTNSTFLARYPVVRGLHLGEKTFTQRQFERDIQSLTTMYRASGYIDVKIDTLVRHEKGSVWITFLIKEGDPIRVASLHIDGGEAVEDRFRIVRDLPVAEGDVFDRAPGGTVLAARDSLIARLTQVGYPAADVSWSRVADSTNPKRVILTYQLTPGPAAVFGKITVHGAEQVDSAFVASLLTLREGQQYRDQEIYRSQRALNSSQLFSYALVSRDSAAYLSDSSKVSIVVDVVEGKMHGAQASLGYAENDCLHAGAGWNARNAFGKGRLLNLSGSLSKIGVGEPFDFGFCNSLKEDSVGSRKANYSIEAAVRRNGFLSPDNTLTFSIFSQRSSEFKVFLREEFGGAVSITRETFARIPVTLSYRISYGRTFANPATFCGYFNSCTSEDIARLGAKRLLAVASLSAVRRRVNSELDPTRGSSLNGELSLSSKYLGSSSVEQFVRVVTDAAFYTPITRNVIIAGHLHAGIIVAPKSRLSGGTENFIPPEQRLYSGGSTDVRGYDQNEMGPAVYVVPRDSVTFTNTPPTFPASATRISPTGGDRVVTTGVELRVPSPVFPSFLRFVGFVDAGALWSRNTKTSLRVTPGIGVRIIVPRFAPIRFDLAYNKYPLEAGSVYTTSATEGGDLVLLRQGFVKPRGNTWTLHFAFGQAF